MIIKTVIGQWQLDELKEAGISVTMLDSSRAIVDIGPNNSTIVNVLSKEEAEKVDLVVCSSTRMFPSDVVSTCADCGVQIVYRPSVPKRPVKVCAKCADVRIKEISQ